MIPEIDTLIISGQPIELECSPTAKSCNYIYGMCWTDKGYIWINKDMPEFLQKQTLLHETVHMIENLYEIKNLSETDVSIFGNVFLQFLQDNPEIVRWLSHE